ncbi:hypothetical protein [Mesoterricola silvestris]|uniref:Uncharacterized protein n=1 Tax=Mesoterricola silvestris TaxID=2927979 RepID=A0AA48K9Q3_9BACT|nr:hypothetical protein [Mesoterricola silvestris]BDU73746.1 hypothetical protein METEAL_29200 [Mesoterricola silvestris]
MSCCSDPKGSCCGQPQALPWFTALCDPVFRRRFLARYWRELLAGALSGAAVGYAALAHGEGIGGLGPALGGPWIHLNASAVLPATLAGGLVLALAPRPWPTASLRTLLVLALGGGLNAFQEGAWPSLPVFMVLGLPALWIAWFLFSKVMGRGRP